MSTAAPEELKNTGRAVNRFYERHPFPGFDSREYSTRDDLRSRASWFARLLDNQLPVDARVADVGCGTGRLAALLSLRGRSVVGVDFTAASLRHAEELRRHLGLEEVRYIRGDLFDMPLRDRQFHAVLSLGVLHHTAAPREALGRLVRLLRPGGLLLVGLYNRFGRLPHRLRQRSAARGAVPGNLDLVSRRLRGQLPGTGADDDPARLSSWYHDQYLHPHELTVSLGRLGRWFEELGVEPLGCFPPRRLFRRGGRGERLFERDETGPARSIRTRLANGMVQAKWFFSLNGAGGYFVQAGRTNG